MNPVDAPNELADRPDPILGVHHAQVTVPEDALPAARAFYCGVLGLVEIEKPVELASRAVFWVRCGDRNVHIGTDACPDRSCSRAHLAYEVADVDRWESYLAGQGIAVDHPIPFAGHKRFQIRDPFGNMIEFIQRTTS
jgi:catechol 2,3-dioxygenase-like lactoylglutathione lyase family enzyme